MDTVEIFGLQFLLSLVVWGLIAKWLLAPWLEKRSSRDALFWLTLPHAFRHMGLVFLVPGVVARPVYGERGRHGDGQPGGVDLAGGCAESIADQRDALLAKGLSLEETEAALDFSPFAERFTGGDEYLANRFEFWFTRPFRKAALNALTGEPMVSLEREQANEEE